MCRWHRLHDHSAEHLDRQIFCVDLNAFPIGAHVCFLLAVPPSKSNNDKGSHDAPESIWHVTRYSNLNRKFEKKKYLMAFITQYSIVITWTGDEWKNPDGQTY